jgi:hypothetical protein
VIRTIGSYLEPGQDVSSKGALVGVLHTLLDAISLLGLRPTAKAQAFQPHRVIAANDSLSARSTRNARAKWRL